MKNFINISDLSTNELRSILDEATSRIQKRVSFNKSEPDTDKPFLGK